MQVLRVFDASLAKRLSASGWKEIKTQYGIEQKQVWTFHYDESRPVCFDINEAIKSGKCDIIDRFTMSF